MSSSDSVPNSGVLLSIFIIYHYLCRYSFKPCKYYIKQLQKVFKIQGIYENFNIPLHYSWAHFDFVSVTSNLWEGNAIILSSSSLQRSHLGELTISENHLLEICPHFLPVNLYKTVSTRLPLNNVQQQMSNSECQGSSSQQQLSEPIAVLQLPKALWGYQNNTGLVKEDSDR